MKKYQVGLLIYSALKNTMTQCVVRLLRFSALKNSQVRLLIFSAKERKTLQGHSRVVAAGHLEVVRIINIIRVIRVIRFK
jgi:hypothetical protein